MGSLSQPQGGAGRWGMPLAETDERRKSRSIESSRKTGDAVEGNSERSGRDGDRERFLTGARAVAPEKTCASPSGGLPAVMFGLADRAPTTSGEFRAPGDHGVRVVTDLAVDGSRGGTSSDRTRRPR